MNDFLLPLLLELASALYLGFLIGYATARERFDRSRRPPLIRRIRTTTAARRARRLAVQMQAERAATIQSLVVAYSRTRRRRDGSEITRTWRGA